LTISELINQFNQTKNKKTNFWSNRIGMTAAAATIASFALTLFGVPVQF